MHSFARNEWEPITGMLIVKNMIIVNYYFEFALKAAWSDWKGVDRFAQVKENFTMNRKEVKYPGR